MTDGWTRQTLKHGRKVVMSIAITEDELDAETGRQAAVLFPMIRHKLNGQEKSALDFGCGAGRFTRYLNRIIPSAPAITVGFEPCEELLKQAPVTLGISWESGPPEMFFRRNDEAFDIVFAAIVLGFPDLDLEATAVGLIRVMKPGGLLVIVDHMADRPRPGWWCWRPVTSYVDLFAAGGVRLEKIGEDRQLTNSIVLLAGRKG